MLQYSVEQPNSIIHKWAVLKNDRTRRMVFSIGHKNHNNNNNKIVLFITPGYL